MELTLAPENLGAYFLLLFALFAAWGGWEARQGGRSFPKVLLGTLVAWALCYAVWAVVPLPSRAWDPSPFDVAAAAARSVEVLSLSLAVMSAGHLLGWLAALAAGVSPSRSPKPE